MFYFSKLFNLQFRRFYSKLCLINDLKEITLVGWINSIIKLKNKSFVKIQDGRSSGSIQVVFSNDLFKENIRRGDCIKVTGEMVESIGIGQDKEVIAKCYKILSDNSGEKPNECVDANERLFSSKNTGLRPEIARKDLLHLRHRLSYYAAIGRIRANLKQNIRNYMLNKQYLEVDCPMLTRVDCEGAGETYKAVIEKSPEVETPNLTVSAQLHLEALVLGYSKVYSLAPVFRGNKSKTRFHLSEFLMLEVESIDVKNPAELCDEIEALVKEMTRNFIDGSSLELEDVAKSSLVEKDNDRRDLLRKICESNFLRISYNESVEVLKDADVIDRKVPSNSVDFNKAQEQHLVALLGNLPVFVTDFPAHLKPFYCKLNKNGSVMAVDFLMPSVGEVAGGSVREDDLDILRGRMRQCGLQEMEWYSDLRGQGGCTHSGFGLGFDRLIQFFTGVTNIQDVVTFPRLYDSCVL